MSGIGRVSSCRQHLAAGLVLCCSTDRLVWVSDHLRASALQAYLGSDIEGEEQNGEPQEAVDIEEYRRRLLSGAGGAAQRKGGKDWAPAEDAAQASHMPPTTASCCGAMSECG